LSVVLDTTVLIDVLRGHRAALDYVLELDDMPFCSEVTRVEILRGLRSAERRHAERLLERIRWVTVDEPIAQAAGELGRGIRSHASVGIADLIIAATAGQLELPLATTNVRHFPMFKGLRPPYRD
jgi:predicted nucleic acid-binding protein